MNPASPLRSAALLLALLATASAHAQAPDPAPPAPPSPSPPAAEPAAPGEDIVVTATRAPRPKAEIPAAVGVVSREELERAPAKSVDEVLRADPSFALFRRSSSVAADPSSQGVKLRNVGSSGVSRALVLVDGIPANDPFGGWVAWRSLPRIGLSRIELVPGGGSALYGNYALGGVIQAFSRPIAPRELDLAAEGGDMETGQLSLRAADRRGALGGAMEGELFRSRGYPVVSESARGTIDGPTPSQHESARVRLEADAGGGLTFDLRGGFFHEALNAGTDFTTAMVRRFEYAGGAHWVSEGTGRLDLALFGHHGDFKQSRTRAGAGRNSEAQSAHQDVPVDDLGASLVWTGPPLELGGKHGLVVGVDARWIRGRTVEDLFPAPPPAAGAVVLRDAGGRQLPIGVFVQDVYDVTEDLGATLALRYDRWENQAASRTERTFGGTVTTTRFRDRSGDALSPKLGLRARLAPWLSARAAGYGAFRAPTLDELYRPFQVGARRTDSNENLKAETLWGGEAGVDLGEARGPSGRLTAFWNEIHDPIVNVTTGVNLAQRQNLGIARIRGLEAEGRWPFARHWSATVAYTLAQARVLSAPGQAGLPGKQLPQAPQHMGTLGLSHDDPSFLTAAAQLRYLGKQYEDDQNTLPMGEALLLDLSVAWHATSRLDVFVSVENLLDKTYLVGRAGVDTIGQPRFVHGGVRLQLGR